MRTDSRDACNVSTEACTYPTSSTWLDRSGSGADYLLTVNSECSCLTCFAMLVFNRSV